VRGWYVSRRSPSPLKAARGDAFRVVYALQIDRDIWVIHAFQKESNRGMKTPKREIDLVRDRLKRLQEMLK
jgi:phage-related protein